ncbi:Metal ABC transporter ATPase [Paraburkholderia sacchari]
MGLGMQIVYLGFAGTAAIEAEAGVQLLRLERFSGLLKACHLAIESVRKAGHADVYDVRLDLLSAASELKPIVHCTGADPIVAMREAFDAAEYELRRARASGCVAQDGRMRRDH